MSAHRGDVMVGRVRLFLRSVLAVAAAAGTTARGAEVTFQSLDGGSSRAAVSAKFPAGHQASMCRAGEATFKSADGTGDCTTFEVPRYEVAGIPFKLTFVFRPGGTLWFAMLLHDWGHPWSADGARKSPGDVRSLYATIEGPLRSKYGAPTDDPPCGMMSGETAVSWYRCDIWQAGNPGRWHPVTDEIRLTVDSRQIKEEVGFAGSLTVTYTFVDRSAANRL